MTGKKPQKRRASVARPRVVSEMKPEAGLVRGYERFLGEMIGLLEQARGAAVRAVNSLMTATYWEIGRRIVEHEQGGQARVAYGEELMERLGTDLTARFGRGFGRDHLELFRLFFREYPPERLSLMLAEKTESLIRESETVSRRPRKTESLIRFFTLTELAQCFPLSPRSSKPSLPKPAAPWNPGPPSIAAPGGHPNDPLAKSTAG